MWKRKEEIDTDPFHFHPRHDNKEKQALSPPHPTLSSQADQRVPKKVTARLRFSRGFSVAGLAFVFVFVFVFVLAVWWVEWSAQGASWFVWMESGELGKWGRGV